MRAKKVSSPRSNVPGRRLSAKNTSRPLYTGTASASYLLSTFGYDVDAGQRDLEDFAVSVAERDLEIADIAHWFEYHSRRT